MAKRSELAKAEGKIWPRCPYCRAYLNPYNPFCKFLDADGNYINIIFAWERRKATFQECPKCGRRWPLYSDYEETVPSLNVSLVETSRSEEFIGNEPRRVENKSSATIQRTLRASKEWTYKIELDTTHTSLSSFEQKLAIKDVSLASQIQNSIQKRYDVSISETQRFEEEVLIAIPKNTSVEATFIWKRIWQNGYVEIEMGQAKLPFRLCVGITFDLRQDEIK
jgi:hypothetical protein